MEYVPTGVAIGAGGYVGWSAGTRIRKYLTKSNMPKRTKHPTQNAEGFRKKIRKERFPRVPRPIPGRTYKTRNAMDSEVVALHDLETVDLTPTADLFGCLQIADVLSAPGLSRYTSR